MCGIAGVITPRGTSGEAEQLTARILKRLSHRGEPHFQAETAASDGWVLGTNRLAIISDPPCKQPSVSSDKSVVLAFNGEVYNHNDLRMRYSSARSHDEGAGDGPVVAESLAADGPLAIPDFDGMFAMIWIDRQRQRAFVSRDRIGIKPLYYAKYGNSLVFASELKALAPEELVREIEEVPPGTWMEISWNSQGMSALSSAQSYFDLDSVPVIDGRSPQVLRDVLHRAVDIRCQYRSAVGVYLSGGVDSSGVFALARQVHTKVIPLVLNRDGASDGAAAKRLLREFGTEPVVEECPSESDLFDQVHDTIRIVESFEPNLVRQSSVQRHIAALAVHAGLKVILCGEGADEVFCGYPEFWSAGDSWDLLRRQFIRDLHRTQLQRVDRMAMWLTTEVRVPNLAPPVLRLALGNKQFDTFVSNVGDQPMNKLWLREALEGVLPDWARWRPKVVLSEGVGLGGNHPETGMFRRLADCAIPDRDVREIQAAFPEWSINSPEEAYYFRTFHALGYSKARFMSKRVRVNVVHSMEHGGRIKT